MFACKYKYLRFYREYQILLIIVLTVAKTFFNSEKLNCEIRNGLTGV